MPESVPSAVDEDFETIRSAAAPIENERALQVAEQASHLVEGEDAHTVEDEEGVDEAEEAVISQTRTAAAILPDFLEFIHKKASAIIEDAD
jgi:hypothetical protein